MAACLDTARVLIRTDTLQVYSRLLAQQTEAATAGGGREREKRSLCRMWNEAVGLLQGLSKLLIPSQPGAACPAVGSEPRRLLDELCAALAHSALLEHLSRALMLVAVPGFGISGDTLNGAEFWSVNALFGKLSADGPTSGAAPGTPAQAHLRAVLSGRCLQHLMACQLVATLCAADGGPSYGMPGELLRGLQLLGSKRGQQTAFGGRGLVVAVHLGGIYPSRLRPRRALTLLLRTARVATASVQPPGTQQQHGPPLRLLPLSASECISYASSALLACRNIILGKLTACTSAGAPLAAAAAAAVLGLDLSDLSVQWWQATLELGEVVTIEHYKRYAGLLEVPLGPLPAGPLPATPPAPLSAALSAGILPWLERALRRAACPAGASGLGTTLPAHAATAMGCLASLNTNDDNVLAHLLAYGEPAAAAALVATMGKLLRLCMHRAAEEAAAAAERGAPGTATVDSATWYGMLSLQAVVMLEAVRVLIAWRDSRAAGSPPSALAPAPEGASRQLLALLWYALVCWLPPLAELALADNRAWPAQEVDPSLGIILSCLPPLLACYPDGVLRSCGEMVTGLPPGSSAPPGSEQAGPSSCAGPSAPPGPEPRVPSGWRAWLLREARAAELVDLALKRRQDICALWVHPSGAYALMAHCCLALAPACAAREREGTDSPALDGGAGAWQGGVRMETLRALSARLAQPAGLCCLGPGAGSVVEWLEGRSAAADEQPGSSAGGDDTHGGSSFQGTARESDGLATLDREQDAHRACEDLLRSYARACRLLPPFEQLPALLPLPPACDHPRCASLAGDSEVGVRLLACRGCGAARYCCRECQVAHWRAGHKEACGRGRGG